MLSEVHRLSWVFDGTVDNCSIDDAGIATVEISAIVLCSESKI